MKKIYKCIVMIIIFGIVLMINSISKAATATLSVTSSGKTVKATVNVNAAQWDLKVTGSSGLNATGETRFYELDNAEGNISKSVTYTFTASNSGTYTINLNGEITDINGFVNTKISDSKTITVAPEPPKPEEPKVEKPNEDDKLTTGATGGTATEVKSSNNYLKSLKLSEGNLSFNKKTTKYTINVPEEIENITITAVAEHSKAKISGTGKLDLIKGTNTNKIEVTAEDGSVRTYTLVIIRPGEEEVTEEEISEEFIGLTSLNLKGVKDNGEIVDILINPKFKTDVFYYECDVPEGVNIIDVEKSCDILDAIIDVTGNENIQDGENLINIILKYTTDGGEEKTVTYQIVVNKLVARGQMEEESEEQLQTNEKFVPLMAVAVICVIIIIILIVRYKKQHPKLWGETEFGTYGEPLYSEDEEKIGSEQKKVENVEEQNVKQENEIIDLLQEENKKFRKKKKGKHF